MSEEKAPEGVNEELWRKNRDLQKQAREAIEKEEQDKRDAAAKAAADPNAGTTSTLPGMTVAEAGAENERLAKEQGLPPLAEANEPKAAAPAPKTTPKK